MAAEGGLARIDVSQSLRADARDSSALWRRSLEQAREDFIRVSGPSAGIGFCSTPYDHPTDELEFAIWRAFEVQCGGSPILLGSEGERIIRPGDSGWAYQLAKEGVCWGVLAVVTNRGEAAALTASELLRIAERAAKGLAAAPAEVLASSGLGHCGEAEANAERWLAMLFSASWSLEVPGSTLTCECESAGNMVPAAIRGMYGICNERRGRSRTVVSWINDVRAASIALIDVVLASSGQQSIATVTPSWDADRGQLKLNGELLCTFSTQATRLRKILDLFHENSWRGRIDYPNVGKDQIQNACKILREKQHVIDFRPAGEGVRWELAE